MARATGPKPLKYMHFMERLNALRVEPTDECELWPFRLESDGYARLSIPGENGQHFVHRVALRWATRLRGEGLQAAHSCRNRHCFNPAHLRWATAKENQADRAKDGTKTQGEDVKLSKLTEDDVRMVRQSSVTAKELAERLGVSTGTIYHIRTNRTWKHAKKEG